MSISFDGVDEEDLEDWRASPVTEHLVRQMAKRRGELLEAIERRAVGGIASEDVKPLAGKSSELRDLMSAIKGESK